MVTSIGDVEIVVGVERDAVRAAEQRGLRMAAVAFVAGLATLAGDGG